MCVSCKPIRIRVVGLNTIRRQICIPLASTGVWGEVWVETPKSHDRGALSELETWIVTFYLEENLKCIIFKLVCYIFPMEGTPIMR